MGALCTFLLLLLLPLLLFLLLRLILPQLPNTFPPLLLAHTHPLSPAAACFFHHRVCHALWPLPTNRDTPGVVTERVCTSSMAAFGRRTTKQTASCVEKMGGGRWTAQVLALSFIPLLRLHPAAQKGTQTREEARRTAQGPPSSLLPSPPLTCPVHPRKPRGKRAASPAPPVEVPPHKPPPLSPEPAYVYDSMVEALDWNQVAKQLVAKYGKPRTAAALRRHWAGRVRKIVVGCGEGEEGGEGCGKMDEGGDEEKVAAETEKVEDKVEDKAEVDKMEE
ncbi:hypothetical protein EDC01DRAFT_635552 [Geopyxis carbonaria]|nr:hypothetical protein EDC01DRAFT_635552 [Geopyxis carbonaria]